MCLRAETQKNGVGVGICVQILDARLNTSEVSCLVRFVTKSCAMLRFVSGATLSPSPNQNCSADNEPVERVPTSCSPNKTIKHGKKSFFFSVRGGIPSLSSASALGSLSLRRGRQAASRTFQQILDPSVPQIMWLFIGIRKFSICCRCFCACGLLNKNMTYHGCFSGCCKIR